MTQSGDEIKFCSPEDYRNIPRLHFIGVMRFGEGATHRKEWFTYREQGWITLFLCPFRTDPQSVDFLLTSQHLCENNDLPVIISDYGSGGLGFDSLRVYHFSSNRRLRRFSQIFTHAERQLEFQFIIPERLPLSLLRFVVVAFAHECFGIAIGGVLVVFGWW